MKLTRAATHCLTAPRHDVCLSSSVGFHLRTLLLLLLAAGPTLALAADQPQIVEVLDLSGRRHSGSVLALTTDSLRLGTEKGQHLDLPVAELQSLEMPAADADAQPAPNVVLLSNEDCIAASVIALNDTACACRWRLLTGDNSRTSLPLEVVRSVLFQREDNPRRFEQQVADWLDQRQPAETVLVENGDRFTGELQALDANQLTLATENGALSLPRAGLVALGMNDHLVAPPTAEPPLAIIRCKDGSRLSLRRWKLPPAGTVEVETDWGWNGSLNFTDIAAWQFLGPHTVRLTDLPPTDYRYHPYLSGDWPLKINRNVTGTRLVVRRQPSAWGIGMHSRSEVTFALERKYASFLTQVAIDDSAAGGGNARVSIAVDDKTIWTNPDISGTSPLVTVPPIDVQGANRLTLKVDFGEDGDVLDRVDWCHPRLTRSTKPTP